MTDTATTTTAPPAASGQAIDGVLAALTEVIRTAASPELQEVQLMLMRRLALEGSVIPSRIPAPLNITEIGGYLNQLSTLGLDEMRTQMLGSVLGLAAGTALSGVAGTRPPQRIVLLDNDRPSGDAGDSVGLTVAVRSEFSAALAAAKALLHAHGGLLPLWTPGQLLSTAASGVSVDPLVAVGRVLWIAPQAALVDPDTDPLTLGRAATDTGSGLRLAVRVDGGAPGSSSLDWTAVVWDTVAGVYVDRPIGATTLVGLDSVLAATGFRPARPAAHPTGPTDLAWARLVNTAGLLPGVTRLGDELRLLYTEAEIAVSSLAGAVDRVWTGTAFTPA